MQVSSLQIRQILSQLLTSFPDPLYSTEALIIRKTSRLKDRLNLLKLRPDNICGQVKKINTQDICPELKKHTHNIFTQAHYLLHNFFALVLFRDKINVTPPTPTPATHPPSEKHPAQTRAQSSYVILLV